MARARQEGSSPEPVEGLARDGPRPFPLSRLVPSAVSCGLCEPGLPPAPATPARLPAAYLCAPTALPAVTAALGAPRWPGGPRSRPRGPHPNGPQPDGPLTPWCPAAPSHRHSAAGADCPGFPPAPPCPWSPGRLGERNFSKLSSLAVRQDGTRFQDQGLRQEEQQRHGPSPWRVLYNLILGLLPLPRGRGAPEMEPN
ncbi:Bcl-2-binding component 3 [Myotis brandtii]|uniref:Bcl-2-binding component 3 n=1 Tax=Myotis brandtii TaxID=109478 RepID=S7MGL3_MYOBR|nr:Bcl-2-binding component 3 [Myotis brandtii]